MSAPAVACSRNSNRGLRSAQIIMMVAVIVLMWGQAVVGQNAKTTDLQFHKFQPKIVPGEALASPSQATPTGIGPTAAQQMQALQQEKASRTPAEQKIDSNLLYTIRMLAGQPAAPGVPYLETGVELDVNDNIVVDMVARVTDSLLFQLSSAHAQVLYTNPELRSIRVIIPPGQIESIAALPDVIFISPKQNSMTRQTAIIPRINPLLRWQLAPGFGQRAEQVRRKLTAILNGEGTPITWQGSTGTEGDWTHRTLDARGTFGIDGTGLKIGVLSDGVSNRALSQAAGDLPPDCGTPPCLTVLSGQAGSGDEGTAMLEIIHDMAPGASLYFATANNGITSFATNIRNSWAAGCQIIVDDVFYFVESAFQDGQAAGVVSTSNGGVVTQAVNDVVAAGALYFSSAGNEGSEDEGTSGTYEGDFVPQAAASLLPSGNVHNFGSGNGYDTITSPGLQVVGLWWADPLGGSGNDYDLYVLNSAGSSILAASTNIQNGTQDPVELLGSAYVSNNNRIVVFQNTGAANRFFHLALFRGGLAVATAGETHGHSAASGAYTVGATPASASAGAATPDGPFPEPFTPANEIEYFSSDGPRRIFFNADSTAITPGNFSSTGGQVLNKPDITAADGVSVTGVGGFGSPFYGTSAAAPSAAAIAALVLAADPTLTAADVRTALTSTAVDIMGSGWDRNSGYGIVMGWDAVNSLGVTGYANPSLETVAADENPGNGNGVIEAGEGASLVIALKNRGGVQAATAITTALTTSTAKVYITQPGTSAYADLAVGAGAESNLSPFTFTLDPTYPCGQTINFSLTVTYTGGPQRVLDFTVPTGLLSITNTLGTKPAEVPGITTATGAQVGRISRNGVISACGTPKPFPGIISGSHTFDSYTFTACQTFCLEVGLDAGASGVNLFGSAYTPSYDSSNIETNYAGDAGLSTNLQSFSIDTSAGTPYTIVVSDVAGNTPPNTYTVQIPACAISCTPNQLPVARAHDVSVIAANTGGTATANIDNGSADPDGDALTLTQSPASPYAVGTTSVLLTVVDTKGATAQATANVTVLNPGFRLGRTVASVSTTAGASAAEHITFTPNPGIAATMTLACSNLPDKSACSFSPSSLPAGSAQTDIVVTVSTTASTNAVARRPVSNAGWLSFAGFGVFAMSVLAIPTKRRKVTAITLTLLCISVLAMMSGCGGGSTPPSYNGTPKGTYTVTVRGTSGNFIGTTTFSLTVN